MVNLKSFYLGNNYKTTDLEKLPWYASQLAAYAAKEIEESLKNKSEVFENSKELSNLLIKAAEKDSPLYVSLVKVASHLTNGNSTLDSLDSVISELHSQLNSVQSLPTSKKVNLHYFLKDLCQEYATEQAIREKGKEGTYRPRIVFES